VEREEVADIGYTYVKKKNLTNAVGISDSKNSVRTYRHVYEIIREIPAMDAKVFNMLGPVGTAYVVNGMMVNNLDNFLPSQVESIVFLRDAKTYSSLLLGIAYLFARQRTTKGSANVANVKYSRTQWEKTPHY
jgi:hypothetical protein